MKPGSEGPRKVRGESAERGSRKNACGEFDRIEGSRAERAEEAAADLEPSDPSGGDPASGCPEIASAGPENGMVMMLFTTRGIRPQGDQSSN
jgi:hypothetical protein